MKFLVNTLLLIVPLTCFTFGAHVSELLNNDRTATINTGNAVSFSNINFFSFSLNSTQMELATTTHILREIKS